MYISIKEFENMTAEEIWSKRQIEDLASSISLDKLEDLRSTINTLSAMVSIANRKDALYLLCGYYTTQLKELSDKSIFINYITNWNNYEFLEFVITDMSQYKNFYRQRDIVDNICKALYYRNKFSTEQENILKSIIKDAKWGVKLKKKFLDKFIDEDLEEERYNYLFWDID
jgi:hypothetical protein